MADENRPTSDEFVCESCGEEIDEYRRSVRYNGAVECETCSRGCCTRCSAESICPECQE